jgi:anti-sigma-K factor RskA
VEDIREYIESGILELYVLGDLSPEEKLQVEAMAAQHTDVKAEIEDIERSMEFYAEANAIEPAEALRDKIMNSLLTNLGDDRIFTKTRKHTEEDIPYEDDNTGAKVIEIPVRAGNFYKYAFAACLALLLVSVYGIVNLYSRLQERDAQLTAMTAEREKIANQVNLMDRELGVYRDPVYKVLRLKGTPKSPDAALTLAWNTSNKKIMLDMKSMKLPAHDPKHQYQLWAIAGGKPIDLGVFDAAGKLDSSMVKEMKAIAAAEMFAVTVEPMGGSVNPTITEMVVAGATN